MNKLFYIAVFCFLAAGIVHAETGEQDNFAKWREWITLKQDYLDKVETLMERGNEIEAQQAVDLQDAMNKKDQSLGDNIIVQNTGKLGAIVDALKAIAPPEDFKEYHEKVTEAFQLTQMANEATSRKNLFSIKECGDKAMTMEIAALESIRKLYVSHGAPSQIIGSIDHGIASYKKKLAK